MAGHLAMLARRGSPSIPRYRLREHLDGLARLRGAAPWFERFEPHEVLSGGFRIHLDVIGVAPAAPTVVFMPGTNAYALLYGEFLGALADRGFNVVGFDPRGHGRSEGGRGSYTLPELVDDMDSVVGWARRRFEGPIVVAGSSQGGITAFYYAASGADIAGALCHNLADLADPSSARLTRFPKLGRALEPGLHAVAKWFPECPVPMSAYLDLASEPVAGLGSARDVLLGDVLTVPFVRLRTLASLAREPLPRPVEAIEVPILVLQAGADAIFPSDYVGEIYDRLQCPKAMKVYPGLPHYMIVDCVPDFIEDVDGWLRQTTGWEGQ